MSAECSNHQPRWVEGPNIFECVRCLYILPPTTGLCLSCGRAIDEHQLLLVNTPVCPERKAAV